MRFESPRKSSGCSPASNFRSPWRRTSLLPPTRRGRRAMEGQSWEDAARSASDHDNPQSHPRVAAWRTAMSEVGISGRKFPSSIESLLRRAFKGGGPPHINPLVDFYNAVSLRHVVPAGGFDLYEITRRWSEAHPRGRHLLSTGRLCSRGRRRRRGRLRQRCRDPDAPLRLQTVPQGAPHDSTTSLFLVSEVLGRSVGEWRTPSSELRPRSSASLRRGPATFIVKESSPEITLR